MKKIIAFLLILTILSMSIASCTITVKDKNNGNNANADINANANIDNTENTAADRIGGKTVESTSYGGVKINEAFKFIADRVAQINSGQLAGGLIYDTLRGETYSAEEIAGMEDYYKNIDIDAQIEAAKEYMTDEAALQSMKDNLEQMKKAAQEGSLGSFLNAASKYDTSQNSIIADVPLDTLPDNDAMKEYNPNDEEATAQWALNLAGDMATASTFGEVSPGLLKAAGLAVTVYPHPLVLNNYASLFRGDSSIDSLFFYFAALEFEPANPIILTNISMTYLDMGNFDMAKGFAEVALQYNPDCGQAYQILTLCHLKDGDSILAAETLFKSTRDCFDDTTIWLFEDYLRAAGELDYRTDEYPMNDITLELLYETARTYVDTADINQTIDTPTNQLTVKPYPKFGGGENILVNQEPVSDEISLNNSEKQSEYMYKNWDSKYKDKLSQYNNETDGLQVINNLRQYYAFEVLCNYYYFMYQKKYFQAHCYDVKVTAPEVAYPEGYSVSEESDGKVVSYKHYDHDLSDECGDALWNKWCELIPGEAAIIAAKKENHDLLNERMMKAPAGAETDAIYNQMIKSDLQYDLGWNQQCQTDLGVMYDICKQYAEKFVELDENWYNQSKQILKEFWLKAGGLMKYMTDPDLLEYCENRSAEIVYGFIGIRTFSYDSTRTMYYWASGLEGHVGTQIDEKYAEYGYDCINFIGWGVDKNTVNFYYDEYERYQEKIDEITDRLGQIKQKEAQLKKPMHSPNEFDKDPADIEKNAIPTFKEQYESTTVGFTIGDYYATYSDSEATWSLPFGIKGKYDFVNDRLTTYSGMEQQKSVGGVEDIANSAFDAGAKMVHADELTEKAQGYETNVRNTLGKLTGKDFSTKEVNDALESGESFLEDAKGVVDAANNVSGLVGFLRAGVDAKTSGDISYGKYVTRDRNGRVIDHGIVYERQVGGDISPIEGAPSIGLHNTVTVMKSKITGTATKNTIRQWKFGFVTTNR